MRGVGMGWISHGRNPSTWSHQRTPTPTLVRPLILSTAPWSPCPQTASRSAQTIFNFKLEIYNTNQNQSNIQFTYNDQWPLIGYIIWLMHLKAETRKFVTQHTVSLHDSFDDIDLNGDEARSAAEDWSMSSAWAHSGPY